MNIRAIRLALRLREQAVELAQRDLAEALAGVDRARTRERAALHDLHQQQEAALSLAAADALVEAFVAWLPEGRRRLADVRDDRDRAEAGAITARAALNAARAAEAAADALLQADARLQRQKREGREQERQHEAAARGHPDRAASVD